MDMPNNWGEESQKDNVSADAFGASSNRLNSWKEIARYLDRQVRTVQLWEKFEGLPVHRHFHSRQGRIFAFRSEIEDWLKGRMVNCRGSGADSAEHRMKIMAASAEMPICPLSDLINETVEMLDLSGFAVVNDFESPLTDYVLRFKPDFEANYLAVDIISAESKEVVWSRSLNGELSPSVLARSIALLSRCIFVDKIWDDDQRVKAPIVSDLVPQLVGRPGTTERTEKVNVHVASDCEIRTWPCLSRGACGYCRCHLW